MEASIGIFYMSAALKVNIHNSNQIWYHESSNDLHPARMSLKRFYFLTRFIEIDDKASREKSVNLTSLHASQIFSKPSMKRMPQ